MYNYAIFLLIFDVICSIEGNYDTVPKIITKDGNLIFESGINKNISFRLRGKSWLNVDNVDILSFIRNNGRLPKGPDEESLINGGDQAELVAEINDLRNRIHGPLSLDSRVRVLENSTAGRISGPNFRQALRRLSDLEIRVTELYDKMGKDNCASNPCQNGGTCLNLYNGFMCECPKEFQGKTCSADVNECALFAGTELGCQNNAQCVNVHGGYSCICNSGWKGIHCTRKNLDCMSSTSLDLCGHGACVNTNDAIGYRCICEQGWKSNGLTPSCTVDVDECADFKTKCFSSCINLMGSFTCAPCPAGFTGNGYVCTDLDECKINNGGCSQSPSVPCLNTHGSYHCGECPLGWTGDGRTCSRSEGGACSSNICHPLASCYEISNTVVCSCPSHMTGNGVGPNGCTPRSGSPCDSSPCMNGGTCVSSGSNYTCHCPRGFSPPNCQRPSTACSSNPCLNGGTCIQRGSSYTCRCPPGYIGTVCGRRQNSCGGIRTELTGSIKYPPSTEYEHNRRCVWLIRTNITKVLNITFQTFDLPESQECSPDWLRIHDGPNTAYTLIGRYCGKALPKGGNLISTRNQLYLWFQSANSTSRSQFELSWQTIDPICGGRFEINKHGTISSPGSPGHYPPDRDCKWQLISPPGTRIELSFFLLQLENHNSCNYDFLAIYEGTSIEDPLLEKFCNSSQPQPLTVPSNEVLLHFHSDNEGSDAGFRIHYKIVQGYPGCGGTFTGKRGEFSSPTFTAMNSEIILCEYNIQLPKDNRIRLVFDKLDLEESGDCDMHYIEIFDGPLENSSSVGKWCGSRKPSPYTSISNFVRVKLVTFYMPSNKGFQAKYEIVCGGKFEDEGIITSPMYPKNYSDDRVCTYEIIAPLDKAIVLEFQDLQIEVDHYGSCNYDYIEIFEGAEEVSRGKYCGNNIPPKIVTGQNYISIKFHADISNSGRGFKANFTFIDKGCGGVLKDPSKPLKPPMSLDSSTYLHNQRCTWTIVAPEGHAVQLIWKSFELEGTSDCYYDFVEIYDNGTATSNAKVKNNVKIGRYCGEIAPSNILSSGNIVTIIYETDETESGAGFLLEFSFLDLSRVCRQHFYTPTGVLQSPDYPNTYPRRINCTYIITVPAGNLIELHVKHFDVEFTSGCFADFIEIRNGASETSPLIGKYCGNKVPDRIPSFSNQLYLRFETDESQEYSGFEIEWDGMSNSCGTVLQGDKGTIYSPNYPKPYMHNAQCEWRIVVSKGSVINIVITDLELETHYSCFYDYLEIYDGSASVAYKMGTYCHSEVPIYLQTTGNVATVRLVTDYSNSERGFQLNYTTNCNIELKSLQGVIESPMFPYPYSPNINCEWKIRAPKGNKIAIEFSHLELEYYGGDCSYDFVEIIQGTNVSGQTYCRSIPPPMKIDDSVVTVKFVTDDSIPSTGFRLEYEVVGCVGTLTDSTGEITSPQYPKHYPSAIECKWLIQAPIGSSIELTIVDMDISPADNCTIASLLITSARNHSDIIGRYCSRSTENITVISHNHEMVVNFYSWSNTNAIGFRATYRTIDAKCGGRIRSHSGFIYSPNYPKNYDSNLDCEWIIEAPEDRTLNLTFIEFDLEPIRNCTADYFELYDGSEANNRSLLLRHCEQEKPTQKSWISSTNTFYIVFHTDGDTEYKGFKLSYEQNCGKTIYTNSSGYIKTDHHTLETGNCTFQIIATNLADHISFFNSLYVESTPPGVPQDESYLNFKCVSFYDGIGRNAPRKTRLCSASNIPIVSNGHALTISMTPHQGFAFAGYYTVFENVCGGTLTSTDGEIASPSYPDSYPVNISCIWNIETVEGNFVELTVTEMNIHYSKDCNEDYLEVRNGSETGELLGVFCGNEPTQTLTANKIWLKFKSDEDGVGKGFVAHYTTSINNELMSNNGLIKSPGYPRPLWFKELHSWRITTDRNTIIVANITEQNRLYATNKFFDGYDNTAPELRYSSDHPVVMTNTNILYFSAVNGPFIIEWHTIPRGSIPINNTDPKSCTNKFIVVPTISSMNFSSPGYPDGYDANLNCNWTFVPEDKNSHVLVQFKNIDLEDNYACTADYVRVSNSTDLSKWEEMGVLCKMEQSTVKEFYGNPYLKIDFETDISVNRSGFEAVLMTACGSSLYGPSGIINGTVYNHNPLSTSTIMKCQWEVTVRRGRKIKVNFIEIDLPISFTRNCESYVMFRNGIHNDSPILGNKKYCGNITEEVPATSSNKMLIQFEFFGHNNFKWVLQYEELSEDCSQQIILNRSKKSALITSPNYPFIPNPHSECVWVVIAPVGTSISAHFIDRIELVQSNNCEKEYLEIRSGATTLSKVIGKYCGMTPNSIRSTESSMRLKYFTDIPEPKGGFQLQVSIENCGGTYHEPNGIISSENYPILGGYAANSVCDYRISRPMGTVVKINFIDINLPSSEERNCNNTDHIELFLLVDEGDDEVERPVLRSLCGEYTIPSAVMENNKVLVRFKTFERTFLYRGFKLSYNSTGTRCVHEFESESGIITTPDYPKGSSRSKRCIWKIRVPKGRRVKVDILDYDLVPNENRPGFANFKRIGFYNDLKFMTIISNVSDPPSGSVYSSDNIMMIYTVMIGNNERRGLKVSYSSNEPTICKGCLDDSCGPISEPSGNLSSYYCEYPIDLQEEETLTLNVTDLLLAANVSSYICNRLSPIKVLTIDGIEVLKLCENSTQFIAGIGIPSSKLVILKNKSNGLRSFNISFIRHKCGGSRTFNGYMEISVPRNVTSTNSPLSCAWQIQPGEGELEHFSLTGFTKFKLDCDKEFIVLYNGPLPNSPHLGRYCGEKTIPNITLTRGVYVEYRTTNFTNESSFKINIKDPEECGGRILHPFRIINFRDGYKNNVECVWDVEGAVGYKLQAVFVDRLYIEKSENCSKDVVEIRDMSEKDWVPPMRVCGRDQPPKFTAKSNRLQITFRSDNDIVGDGFSINFTQVCGGVFPVYKQKHLVYSPNYPHDYDPYLNCNYTFVPEDPEKVIVLRFLDVQLEQSYHCKYDNITIHKHTSTSSSYYTPSPPLTACSAVPLYEIRHQDAISVVFQTDNQIQDKGFIIEYGYEDCGGVITTPQIVSSPRQKLDGKYAHNMDCFWNITAPQGKKIVIKFEELKFEYGTECFYDYVEIYSGEHLAIEQRRARLCGDINGTVINVENNKAILHSHSDHSDYSEGFKALIGFVEMCDHKVTLEPGSLTYEFKAFYGPYANNLDCQYIFKAPDNHHIQIQFEDFHIATCGTNSMDECNCDYVEIRDGAGPFAELIEKACGHTPPPRLITTKSTAYVRFVSDSETSSTGFKATVKAIETVCGTTKYNLDDHNGKVVITSPGSGTYLPNLRCQWEITSNHNDIHLFFEKFDLQDADSNHKCSSDVLVVFPAKGTSTVDEGLGEDIIFAGQQQQSISTYYNAAPFGEHMFCGNTTPSDYYTNSREVFLKFITDDQVEKSGFKITAGVVEGCYKNYTSTQGRIYLQSAQNCVFSINAPENYSLTLYYDTMYFGYYTCDTEKIEVYDGKSNQLLQKLCGDAAPPRSLFTNTNKLAVKIFSSGVYNSFDITYLASNTGVGCGGELFNYQGIFTSPFYPLNARNYSDCRWNIRVPQNLKVLIQFQEFDLGSSTTCRSDYLQIIEVEDNHTRDEEVRRYCGGDTPKYYRGKRSYLSVRFRKTVNFDGTGWIILFKGIHENAKIEL